MKRSYASMSSWVSDEIGFPSWNTAHRYSRSTSLR